MKSSVKKIRRKKTTFGTLAIAQFWIVVVSGIILMVPFKISTPYLSISEIVLLNPWASVLRNIHFWSSQIFLVFSLLHLYDHFHKKKKIGFKAGVALRLSIGVLIIFLAMITGFLLKGDADSQQARQVLNTLALNVPLIGKSLAFSLLGNEDSYLLIYIHHIVTFTVFIAIILVEHSGRYLTTKKDFIYSVVPVLVLSCLFTAPLHDNINPTVKGPWYFVGFQEILHWMSKPGWSVLIMILIVGLLFLVNYGKKKITFISKRVLLGTTIFYGILTIIGLFFRGEQWKWKIPGEADYKYSVLHSFKTSRVDFFPEFEMEEAKATSEIFGRKEGCLMCHTKTYGFAESHNPETIGCFSCHGGNPVTTHKKQAHKNMLNIPGNLNDSKQTCGTAQCHPDIVERVPTGLMSTLSGMISVNRTVFNEQTDLDKLTNVHKLGNSAADEHLKNLCVRCHLGNPKTEYGPAKEWTRGGGCLACHLNYSESAEKALHSRAKYIRAHPSVDLKVTNNHCFGCHNRSGRIATNYEGWHETTLNPEQMPEGPDYRLLEGRRVFEKQQADVHHELGLECIDCHHSYELMGDGKLYAHQEDQQDVQCIDCHFSEEPKTISASELDYESSLISALRFGNNNEKQFLKTQKHNRPLINTFVRNDTAFMLTKNRQQLFELSAPAEICNRNKAHSNVSCSSCHSSWASSCIGCHNSYDEKAKGYNMLEGTEVTGTWVETKGSFEAKLPALGLRKLKDKNEVVPVIPGMVLTIDKKSFTKQESDSVIYHRLFAPVAPHTTSAKGRGCKSCHNSSVALGFGEGKLHYRINHRKGEWHFIPEFENNPQDSLPGDAWIGFLQERNGMVATRKNVGPFDIEKQKQILTVGACLTCHDENSEIMLKSLNQFDDLVKKRNIKCILPEWE